jgi:hypothetical protein
MPPFVPHSDWPRRAAVDAERHELRFEGRDERFRATLFEAARALLLPVELSGTDVTVIVTHEEAYRLGKLQGRLLKQRRAL